MDKMKSPTAVESWVNLYPFLEKFDWEEEIYAIPFKYTKEPYLQSIQYQIINIILNTNEKLEKMQRKQNNLGQIGELVI